MIVNVLKLNVQQQPSGVKCRTLHTSRATEHSIFVAVRSESKVIRLFCSYINLSIGAEFFD